MQTDNNKDLQSEIDPIDRHKVVDGEANQAHSDQSYRTESDQNEESRNPEDTPLNDEEAQLQHQPEDGTLVKSSKRIFGNSSFRVVASVVTCLIVILGLILYAIASKATEEAPPVAGEIEVPKTSTQASAVVTPEQAAFIKAQQEKQGLDAEQRGETYIAEFVTERPPEDDLLGDPVQPIGSQQQVIDRKKFFDDKGNSYTSQEAARLAAEGQQIKGVTFGAGSVTDPNLGSGPNTRTTKSSASGKSAKTEVSTYQPYVIKPYQPSTGADNTQSELVATNSAALDQSVKDVEEWNNQYLAMRVRKAALYDAKAQLSFEKQMENLEHALKPPIKNVYETRYSTTTYPSSPAQTTPDQPTTSKPAVEAAEAKPLIYAGETFRAILKNEVNTDHGTEVIATLLQGPFKGATLIGVANKTSENIQFNFTRLLQKGKPDIAITATARQIGTNSSGMADSIKKHYLKRYSALVISSALSGIGEAYEQTSGSSATIEGSTVISNATEPSTDRIIGNAVGELGDELSDEIKKQQNTPTTFITKTGKVFNVFFSQSVTVQSKK